jgi:hypothetical protein
MISSSAYKLPVQFPDQPITDKIPKKYMLDLIRNLKNKENLSKEEVLNILEQAVEDYDDSNKVISIFSKPKKENKKT